MSETYRICSRCIMDTTDPDITFDEEGQCNHCRTLLLRLASEGIPEEVRDYELSRLTDIIRREGKGKDYDCIIGLSGGVDSTMVAIVVKQLGLRPLAVHFDNGWDSELAVDNIKKTLDVLRLDLFTHVVDWDEFRDLQLSFLKASISNAEIPTDHGIFALLYEVAARERIRFILTGSNLATEGMPLPLSWGYYSQDLRLIRSIHHRFGSIPLKTFPQISLANYVNYLLIKKIRQIPFLNYIQYKKSEAVAQLQKELGWRPYGGKHYESIYTRFYQGHILSKKFGFDKRRIHLSTQICTGGITRESALQEIEKDPYAGFNLEDDKAFVIKKLGITTNEFEHIMRSPARSYRDYQSNAFFFVKSKGLRNSIRKLAIRA